MSKTKDNLRQALEGESRAYLRYLACAEKADGEGYHSVARLFRAAAKAEMVHAKSHQCALGSESEIIENLNAADKVKAAIAALNEEGQIQETLDNLKTAIDGETYEFKKMYPAMVQDAVSDKDTEARYSLEYAMSVEMVHAKLFKKALEDLKADGAASYHVCPVCGYTVADKAPKKCPYCGVDAGKFMKVT